MLWVAGYFHGLKRGDQARANAVFSVRVYNVADLMVENQPSEEQLDAIATLVRDSIAPTSWANRGRGGQASLEIFPTNRQIVVHQAGSEHQQIEKLIETLASMYQEEVQLVKYDASQIINSDSAKPVEEQLATICSLANQMLKRHKGLPPSSLSIDKENQLIVASARKHTHDLLDSYIKQLRFAREAIRKIDS
jgi:hypothetical protein